MKLKEYQVKSVEKLLTISKKLLNKGGTKSCVVKAPTGAGKTIIIAEWLSLLAKEPLDKPYAFIWISGNNLHKQSKDKLQPHLADTRYTLSFLDNISGSEFQENEIVFVNWHSLTKQDRSTGEYTNIFMRDNEDDRNLKTFVSKTKNKGLGIILIVDESHYHYWSNKSQELVLNIIGPSLILEVSATPTITPTPEELEYGDAGQITVRFDDVIAEGMIKKEVVINAEIGENSNFNSVADKVILETAIKKREQLKEIYEKNGLNINPLLLIQLPSEGETTSALDESKLEQVIKLLKENHDITTDNFKLGIWLSDEKDNLTNIEQLDNQTEVLIFKQAIALGWDCPRAQVLVMFREIKSHVFEVQTVGRILRMPQAKHYEILELDRAYVYTNIDRIAIKEDKDSMGLFQVHPSHKKQNIANVDLPSIYLRKINYGDLTLKFRRLFREEANSYFGIKDNDTQEKALTKADVKLDLKPSELGQPIIADAVFTDIDSQIRGEIAGTNIHFAYSEDEIKHQFVTFAKLVSLPYAPAHSSNKVQMAIYEWFDDYLGYKEISRLDIQRIVVCSENNQKIFREIIEAAKLRFRDERKIEINNLERKREYLWNIPTVEYFNEYYSLSECNNYAHGKCYVLNDRSQPEKDFEQILIQSKNVVWWWKNGVQKETCFAIEYKGPKSELFRAFYPDFIVSYTDGSVGLYDTKSGVTAEMNETKAKSDALQAYIRKHKDKKLKGGIVQSTQAGMYVFEGETYVPTVNSKGWVRLEM